MTFRSFFKKTILTHPLLIAGVGLAALLTILWRSTNEETSLPKWHLVSVSKKGAIYLDSQSVKMAGENIRIKALNEVAETETDIAVSVISIEEVDCRAKRSRTLSYTAYPGPMGAGEPLASVSEPDDWSVAAPNTMQETVIRLACVAKRLVADSS